MAKEGKKLELYEILAAKRDKGKRPLGLDSVNAGPVSSDTAHGTIASYAEPASPSTKVIVDEAVQEYVTPVTPAAARPASTIIPAVYSPASAAAATVEPPILHPDTVPVVTRPRSPREVVFALDTAFIFFTVVLALVGSSYFLGYKRGQEERPAGLTGLNDIEVLNPDRISIRHLSPAPRAAVRPPEQDFTLILRTEPAGEDLPERLELELSEAVARGRQAAGTEIQGFIFRTTGSDPRYVLSVGLGRTANDAELGRLLQIYNRMEGVTLSREPRPYIGCRIAPIRELGDPVY